MSYAELQCLSNFSFLEGASHADEMAIQAAALGLAAISIADRNSLAGIVRAHQAAKEAGIRLVVGARLDLTDGPSFLCWPTDRAAYGRLCRLLTLGKRRAGKGGCILSMADLEAHAQGQVLGLIPPGDIDDHFGDLLLRLRGVFSKGIYIVVSNSYCGDDRRRLHDLARRAQAVGLPLLATNDVRMHHPARRRLADVLTCIREGCTLAGAGFRLAANAERHLKPPDEMARLFCEVPEAVANTLAVVERCRFSLDELRYEYPAEGGDLARLAWDGAAARYPAGVPPKVKAQIAHELALIGQLGFAPYFLTVYDIVRFARSRGILCQGRGSAANSAVCYCLGITSVDPDRIDVLFERFVSAERGEPPDIDVDFENERREEVIQYIYARHGRERSGMTATVITYRSRSALREVGKVLGLAEDAIVALQRAAWRRGIEEIDAKDLAEAGLDDTDRTVSMVLELAAELRGFPRHLSQHTGGMVIARGRLDEVVPIANAAMEDRTVIEWDKTDLDSLGILKVDILGLGMLTCIRKAFGLIETHHGRRLTLANVPPEDPAVYAMLCRGDSLGVFQVESRAQMAMLPRLKPRCFYDLVIEVAIVRPGPIQGDMVHPYLRRRRGEEAVDFPSDELRQVLGKTLGIPLFQEQAMRIAMVAAGFSGAEADGLRRAMAAFRRSGRIHHYREKFQVGMAARGYDAGFAERCFRQIEGFAEYGFPESHAASFALLVYVSAWLKRHYPAAFACALLNSQPMGFYAPAQILRDAADHGVEVRPVDVAFSDWDCTLEDGALRLGFRQAKGLAEADARRVAAIRGGSVPDLWRAGVPRAALEALARADAFRSQGVDRRQAFWAVKGLEAAAPLPLFAHAERREAAVVLPAASPGEEVADDYRSLGLSLKAHPAGLLRPALAAQGYGPAGDLADLPQGRRAAVAGLVIARQQPGSAKGVVFVTLEDETGIANLIVWPQVLETHRRVILGA
ncbi:MAG: error-prone DNA polymerase, partial [Magnetospirillum sp. WYHS-4]